MCGVCVCVCVRVRVRVCVVFSVHSTGGRMHYSCILCSMRVQVQIYLQYSTVQCKLVHYSSTVGLQPVRALVTIPVKSADPLVPWV